MAKQSEYFFPLNMLTNMCGISQADYIKILQFNDSCKSTAEGVPLFALLSVLNKGFQASVRTSKVTGEEGINIAQEMHYENLMKARILNQTKLGILMRKSEAYNRTLQFVTLLVNLVQHVFLNLATKMVEKKYIDNKREAEIFLIDYWNEVNAFIEDNVEILDWEEDGDAYLVRTRLQALSEIDSESFNLDEKKDEFIKE
ncbi:MAG: hypothetical protein ACTSXT_13825 [Candidatus Helarchaeota archaeon]